MKRIILTVFIFLCMISLSFAAGSCTVTVTSNYDGVVISLAMVADGSGDCDACSFTANGYHYGMNLNPGTASDDYDLVLNDSDDLDVLNGIGANMSNAAGMTLAEKYLAPVGPNGNYLFFVGDTLTLVGDNMGAAGTGSVDLIFSRTSK